MPPAFSILYRLTLAISLLPLQGSATGRGYFALSTLKGLKRLFSTTSEAHADLIIHRLHHVVAAALLGSWGWDLGAILHIFLILQEEIFVSIHDIISRCHPFIYFNSGSPSL